MSKVAVNGVIRDATAEEQAQIDAREKEWADSAKDRKLSAIKRERLDRLQQTDWMAYSDVTMPDNIKTWRQELRDLPQTYTTEDKYDELLATDEQGNLTHTVWSKP
mgnify:CR=1 FL=1|tara:strand:- start:1304 stop:1621 length:318 start_codon:yes stop_codon:yes gene_type:complete